jgi:hypothetical protein
MSIIGLRFRSMAARIKVLSLNHPDLAVEKVRLAISDRLTEIVDRARSNGVDLDDPYEVWELLSIDAVISLEDIQGQHHRVAISIVENESRAYRLMKQRQTYSWKDLRVSLGIHCHWIFCVNAIYLVAGRIVD